MQLAVAVTPLFAPRRFFPLCLIGVINRWEHITPKKQLQGGGICMHLLGINHVPMFHIMVEVVIAMIILIVLHNCSFLSLIVYDTR